MADQQAVRFLAKAIEEGETDFAPHKLLERARSHGQTFDEHQLEEAAAHIVARLAEAGELDDDALDAVSGGTLATFSLQSSMQTYTQSTTVLSNVSKTSSDTQMAIIRSLS